jgi:hypothetical protein
VTDTQGHMLTGIVHEASIQDRDGAPRVIGFACESFPTVTHVFADSGYAGEKLEAALAKMNGKRRWCPIDFSGSGGFSDVRFF